MVNKVTYRLVPFDTLFFRGTLPLEAGKGVSQSLFPPNPASIIGAFRTLMLEANGVSIDQFRNGYVPAGLEAVGSYSKDDQRFAVSGIFLEKDGTVFAKAPASLFVMEDDSLAAALPCSIDLFGIKSSSECPVLAPSNRKAGSKSLADAWVDVRMFSEPLLRTISNAIAGESISKELFSYELRTGIAIDSATGSAKEHMLYSSMHVRLCKGVSILVTLTEDLKLPDKGVMKLGGEGRLVSYERIERRLPDATARSLYVSTVPIAVSEENEKHMIASSKPVMAGGWDYARHFYKDSMMYYPAGTVFDCDIEGRTISWIDGGEDER